MKKLNEDNDAPGQHSSATIPHNDASSGQNTTINGIADWTLFFFFSIFFSAHLGTELGVGIIGIWLERNCPLNWCFVRYATLLSFIVVLVHW